MLHAGMISFSIGFFSFFLALIGAVYLLLIETSSVEQFIGSYLVVLPVILWVSGILGAVVLYSFVRCQSCGKLLLIVTKMEHENKNKKTFFWFLRDLPPKVVCEHCGVEYEAHT
jgi:asparagine N-glycosylation enzyme membrane subunit Stt3